MDCTLKGWIQQGIGGQLDVNERWSCNCAQLATEVMHRRLLGLLSKCGPWYGDDTMQICDIKFEIVADVIDRVAESTTRKGGGNG